MHILTQTSGTAETLLQNFQCNISCCRNERKRPREDQDATSDSLGRMGGAEKKKTETLTLTLTLLSHIKVKMVKVFLNLVLCRRAIM